MGPNRLFVSQSKLDQWLSEELVEVDGEVMMTKNDGNRYDLKTAVLFLEEVTGAGDPSALVGKVKDLEQIVAMGGEYASGSVIHGDHAYTVVEGFVGDPMLDEGVASAPAATGPAAGESLAAAMRSVIGEPAGGAGREGELDLLARFFLASRSS